MAVKLASFKVAGTNAGRCLRFWAIFPGSSLLLKSSLHSLCPPCCRIVGSIVTCTLLLLEHWATCRNRRVSLCVNWTMFPDCSLQSCWLEVFFFFFLNNLISECCNLYSYLKVRDHISSSKQNSWSLFGDWRIRRYKKFLNWMAKFFV